MSLLTPVTSKPNIGKMLVSPMNRRTPSKEIVIGATDAIPGVDRTGGLTAERDFACASGDARCWSEGGDTLPDSLDRGDAEDE